MKSKIKEVNWYGFNHEAVAKKFEGDLTYVRTLCLNNEYNPVAVYRAANPNREKGHKDFMLLQIVNDLNNGKTGFVRGLDEVSMQRHAYQEAVKCLDCGVIVYSINRHHCHKCGCPNETMIDGGKEYTRFGAKDMTRVQHIKINLLSGRVVKPKKP